MHIKRMQNNLFKGDFLPSTGRWSVLISHYRKRCLQSFIGGATDITSKTFLPLNNVNHTMKMERCGSSNNKVVERKQSATDR